uniref:Uncharacterized protein n=1 Tax=Staphylothermus marinus TaxID=2280 RepID=A0A7C4D8C4_STAMA
MATELRISEEDVRATRVFFTIGYILRIFPFINIFGFVLTFISWLKLSIRLANKFYKIALIGAVILLISIAYSLFVSTTIAMSTFEILPPGEITFDQYKELLRNTTIITKNEMENPGVYITELAIGLGLILESLGIRQLYRDTRRFIPIYLTILFIALGIIHFILFALHPLTAPGLDNVIKTVDRAESLVDLKNAYTELLIVLLPLTITGVINFFITLITYILTGYKYWKLYGELVKLRIATTGIESSIASI